MMLHTQTDTYYTLLHERNFHILTKRTDNKYESKINLCIAFGNRVLIFDV